MNDILNEDVLKELYEENSYLIRFAEEIASFLEKRPMEELESLMGVEEERIMKFLALEGNPTLGEAKALARAAGKRLIIDFSD